MKKRRFTLIEVVIALAITALCAPILFSLPFRLVKKQINSFFQCELARLSLQESLHTKIDIIQRKRYWRELTNKQTPPKILEEKQIQILFSPHQKRAYLMKKTLLSVQSKSQGRLLKIKISFQNALEKKEKSFTYSLFLQT